MHAGGNLTVVSVSTLNLHVPVPSEQHIADISGPVLDCEKFANPVYSSFTLSLSRSEENVQRQRGCGWMLNLYIFAVQKGTKNFFGFAFKFKPKVMIGQGK